MNHLLNKPNLAQFQSTPSFVLGLLFFFALVSYRDGMHGRCRCITKVPNHLAHAETALQRSGTGSTLDKPGDLDTLVFAATEGGQKHSAMT